MVLPECAGGWPSLSHGDRLNFSFDPARAHLFHPGYGTAFGAAWWTLKASKS